jgi:hypothetical protein
MCLSVGGVDNKGGSEWGQGVYVSAAQFCCGPKTALKDKVNFLRESK